MASNEEGNKGIKRKSQKSAEGSANKHLCPSISSGITHDDQVSFPIMQSTAGPSSSFNIKMTNLHLPDFNTLKEALDSELKTKEYSEITIEIAQCPNLTQDPFNLIQKGIGGNTAVFNFDNVNTTYEIKELLERSDIYDRKKDFFILGSGMAHRQNKELGELVMNQEILLREKKVIAFKNKNRFTYFQKNETCAVEMLPQYIFPKGGFTKGTFYLCDGIMSPVLKIYAKVDTCNISGPFGFIDSMQNALYNAYGKHGQNVGGIYIVNSQRGWEHAVTRNDGKSLPADSSLQFCHVRAPEPIISIFDGNCSNETPTTHCSQNPSIEINSIKSYHSLSHHNAGNHHHFYELEGETAEFTGYFSPVQKLYHVSNQVAQ